MKNKFAFIVMSLSVVAVVTLSACRLLQPMPSVKIDETEVIVLNPGDPSNIDPTASPLPLNLLEKTTIPSLPPERWNPALGDRLQIQFDVLPIDLSIRADIFDIDVFDNDSNVVADLQARGHKVICYINVGAWEDWRPDAKLFPQEIIGSTYAGWAGENWLDIRRLDLLGPLLQARLDLCKQKGFDGVEPDNINGYDNDTGFALTAEDQLKFNKWLADEAHQRGLTIGLKNDPEQIPELIEYYDFSVLEDCFDQGWCNLAVPFINAGKPVFAVEYTDHTINMEQFCSQMQALKYSGMLKNRGLDVFRQGCD